MAKWQHVVGATPSGLYRVFLGPFDCVIPKTPQAIVEIMSQYAFEKPALNREGLVRSLGVGLVVAEGDVHRFQRRIFNPIFGLNRNRRLVPQVWPIALILREKIEDLVKKSRGSVVLDVHSLTMATTLDIVGITTLGVNFDSIRNPSDSILQAYEMVYPSPDNPSLIDQVVGIIFATLVPPRLLFKLPLRSIRQYHKGMRMLRSFYLTQIRQKRKEIENTSFDDTEPREKDILSALIASGLKDDKELLSHVLTTMAAGHDTTAVTLDWAIYRLSRHPEVQDRLRAEIQILRADQSLDTIPSLDAINSMPYLRAFVMEVLRFYPAVPLIGRVAASSTTVGGVVIAKGQGVLVSPYAINRQKDLWGEDAHEFDVGRWEASPTGGAKSAQALYTFSGGPRICVGKDLALISIKVLLVVLVERFCFEEVVPGFHPPFQKDTTLKAQGLKVKVSVV
ncbi:hypothetical protein PFICI_11725 [Pestalotiopsis fici W106-1]|uniref:Cytochrome P450 n=1 Tax=Pestalotiopsis fici (strain W106-1 / CGMCC3.15140) TaxID=1229662 RepID=W3WR69_PESFW|nr:uncharacterized protein PFICI_11725 [Pestalotiopsis fici W106-1]ETS76338.1 hypothetical protein PFICI_11725 [Pestalotiopsis fici W106-1]